jgi:hypothetical protein
MAVVEEPSSPEPISAPFALIGEGGTWTTQRNVKINGWMLQERFDLGCADVFWVLPFVEEDVTLGPIDVSLFGTEGIVLQANRIAHLVEEPSRPRSRVHFVGSIRNHS